MCGICGQYWYRTRRPADAQAISRMSDTIAHRGPDDEGMHLDGALGLGFRRLSIIDLSAGHQPMSDSRGRIWLVFNGEIYNFKELRRRLESHGHHFRTNSDTEAIIHGYQQWGIDVLERLNGMFAIALWDSRKRRLLLARDRAGIKGLYYAIADDGLVFGSEIRPILEALPDRPAIDPVALDMFLRYRYTPSPLTVWQGIRKLAPGTRLVIEHEQMRVERWWHYRPWPLEPVPSVDEAQDRLLELYRQAVERQLVSDVPLGLLLSGGLDSGLLLALMNRRGAGWKTFTVGFGRSFADDELDDAARTASILGAPNIPVQIDRATFEDVLPRIVSIVEEPIATPSVVPMYFVCALARGHVKVALMGQGPDELFGGYRRHVGVAYGRYWRAVPRWMRGPVESGLRRFSGGEAIRRGLDSIGAAAARPGTLEYYQQVFSIMPGEGIDALFADGVLPRGAGDRILDCWRDLEPLMAGTDDLGGLQFLEIRSSLPDELLMYADKLSMHHSLEVRVPYLDHDIIEYVECLPSGYKVRHGARKWLHARVCRDFLPAEVLRRRKRGFAVNVVSGWFREAMAGRIGDLLGDPASLMYDGLLRRDPVMELMRAHRSGRADNHKILFSLVVLEQWLRDGALAGVK
ncbi:MAG: asparagine synthase (glutamine-hydrolyzing) [Candidatus Sumerlaeia bacterium]